MPTPDLSPGDARRLALAAQGLLGAPPKGPSTAAVAAVVRRLGAVQLDTISVLARSHELIAYARLGPIGRPAIERAYWSGDCFEYWSHAACILPVENWPLYSFRRKHFLERGKRWHDRPADAVFAQVRARLADGPASAGELGGARRDRGPAGRGEELTRLARAGDEGWWNWSGAKIAVEFLLDTGEIVCVRREGWRRIYDLPERVIPRPLHIAHTLDDRACFRELVTRAGAALGVATVADLADYPRISRAQVTDVLAETGLVPVRVAGWREQAWADPGALAGLGSRARHRTTLLSPFDSLIWDRNRTRRLFGFSHALEAYKPAAKRDYGYFAMPLLAGGKLLGRVDPKRVGHTLVGLTVALDSPGAVEPMAVALRGAAQWVGATDVRVQEVRPAGLAGPLNSTVRG